MARDAGPMARDMVPMARDVASADHDDADAATPVVTLPSRITATLPGWS